MKRLIVALLTASLLALGVGGIVGCGANDTVEKPANPEPPPASQPSSTTAPPPAGPPR